MRTIDYNEYILNIKSDFYYINLAYQIKYDSTYLKKVLLNEEQHFEKFYDKHPVSMFVEYLEVLVHDNILSEAEINKHFAQAEINSTMHYQRLLEYITAYEYRQIKVDFPFKLRVNVGLLRNKINAEEVFKAKKHDFIYTPYNLNAMTFEELIEKYKNNSLYNITKRSFNDNPSITNFGNDYVSSSYPCASDMLVIMQIFSNENILTNKQINKMFAELDLYANEEVFALLFDYLNEYLFIKHTTWHKYTIELDVDMLLNKVMLFYSSEYKNLINQERFNAIFEKYNIAVDYSMSIEERQQLDLFYREKYRKLCEAEEKNIK